MNPISNSELAQLITSTNTFLNQLKAIAGTVPDSADPINKAIAAYDGATAGFFAHANALVNPIYDVQGAAGTCPNCGQSTE